MNKVLLALKDPYKVLSLLLRKTSPLYKKDKLYLKMLYYLTQHERLNLKNPQKFTEKIQWLKLYNRKPEYTTMVDKYAVKDYVANIIGKEYIIPTIGVWDRPEDIDFDKLPNRFVLKTTHGGGSGGVIICKDKGSFDREEAIVKLRKSLNGDIYQEFREWPYKNVPKRIIAEQYMEDMGGQELRDYKFFCFNGKPIFCQVIANRRTKETIDFFDIEWRHQEFVGLNPICGNADYLTEKPKVLPEMIHIASKLSAGIPFLRVDLYFVNGKVYFGEITFYPASGMGRFTPYKYNEIIGKLIELPFS